MRALLRLRKRLKSRKPEFRRYCWDRKLKLRRKSWRKPRGLDNAMRMEYGGKWSGRKRVKVGFKSPLAVRGLHPSGYEDVLVYTPKDLEKLDPKRQAVRIASCVGLRKRLEIEKKANEMGLKILNPSR
ncbi:MAG: 50S ribosomal protein L32e [Archaeoglobales archaeon]|jgi:large subunit ribosomal protein L32e|nr:50S ribosomal protein L32e [Archaeoglobi archaeon]NHW23405.1 50S ribosomal protein L32e [Archaeoglobales archaeon]